MKVRIVVFSLRMSPLYLRRFSFTEPVQNGQTKHWLYRGTFALFFTRFTSLAKQLDLQDSWDHARIHLVFKYELVSEPSVVCTNQCPMRILT